MARIYYHCYRCQVEVLIPGQVGCVGPTYNLGTYRDELSCPDLVVRTVEEERDFDQWTMYKEARHSQLVNYIYVVTQLLLWSYIFLQRFATRELWLRYIYRRFTMASYTY
jgi:hypothetical protein